jgi:hypothetical protein
MGRLETAKLPINEGYPRERPSLRDEAPGHPPWCGREWCSAYEPEEIEPRYHRSKPYMIETDDPHVVLAVHLGANSDGSDPYVELAELLGPLLVPFWAAEPAEGRLLVLPLDQVDAIRHILGSMSRAAR